MAAAAAVAVSIVTLNPTTAVTIARLVTRLCTKRCGFIVGDLCEKHPAFWVVAFLCFVSEDLPTFVEKEEINFSN